MFIFLSPIVIEKCNIPVKCRNKYSDPAVFKREIFVKFVKKKKVFLLSKKIWKSEFCFVWNILALTTTCTTPLNLKTVPLAWRMTIGDFESFDLLQCLWFFSQINWSSLNSETQLFKNQKAHQFSTENVHVCIRHVYPQVDKW